MLKESGRIVAVESEGLWVETIQRSTCGSCAARSGCGQSLLARFGGHSSYLWVSLQGREPSDFHVGDDISLGVHEEVVAQGSLLVYLLPLITMVAATVAAHNLFALEGLTILAGLAGLLAGGGWVRWRAYQTRHDSRLQPVLLDNTLPVQFS
ncbi:MAG TPA: SoxR reducing system RseC family protein [Cellvibrionaceae bacterium]